MKTLTKEEVQHIANLANLSLSDEELEKFSGQLSKILDYVEEVSEVDTSTVSPITNILGTKNIFREDVVTESLTQSEALANTRASYQGFFKVKAVFDR